MKLKRIYEVEVVPSREIEEVVFDQKQGKMTTRKRVVKNGFNVFFPQGHSTFFENKELMLQAGISEDRGLVDMDTGMPAPPEMAAMFETTLKERVARNNVILPPSQRLRSDNVSRTIAEGE